MLRGVGPEPRSSAYGRWSLGPSHLHAELSSADSALWVPKQKTKMSNLRHWDNFLFTYAGPDETLRSLEQKDEDLKTEDTLSENYQPAVIDRTMSGVVNVDNKMTATVNADGSIVMSQRISSRDDPPSENLLAMLPQKDGSAKRLRRSPRKYQRSH